MTVRRWASQSITGQPERRGFCKPEPKRARAASYGGVDVETGGTRGAEGCFPAETMSEDGQGWRRKTRKNGMTEAGGPHLYES